MILLYTRKTNCPLGNFLTFHDLLQLHLQGLDCPHWVLTSLTVHPVDGELSTGHHCNVIIFHVQHLVGVLNDGTVGADETDTCHDFTMMSTCLMFGKGAKPVSF